MCGRYTLATPNHPGLRSRFGLDERVEVRRRFNVAPGDHVVAVTADRDGRPRGDVLRWGLVPHWADDPKLGVRMINARAEGVAERPAFRDAFGSRRCLILADGFYEWERRPDGAKQPWWITRADGEPFAFAGLWATWRPPGDGVEPLRSCAIVTTRANSAVARLHDRMPVILDAGGETAWLDAGTPAAALHGLLTPLPDDATALRAVGPAVNDARHDAEDCLDPPGPTDAPPATLF